MTGEQHERAVEAAARELGGEMGDVSAVYVSKCRSVIDAYHASLRGEADISQPNPQYDATNSVRLCVRCEGDSGVSAGADVGDCACAVCGARDAPHVYPALQHGVVLVDLREVTASLRAMAVSSPVPQIAAKFYEAADVIERRFGGNENQQPLPEGAQTT